MHKLASVNEKDIHKLLWDFDIQTDHQKTRAYDNVEK